MATSDSRKRARIDAAISKPKDVVEIDPKGDIVLAAGQDPPVLLRMSSVILTRASKVFEIMLEGSFCESLTQYTSQNPLKLPDDNGHAMEMLCKLLMHQYSDIKDIMPKDLPGLIVVCDKYSCLSLLRIWFQMGLTQYLVKVEAVFKNEKHIEHKTGMFGLTYVDALAITYLIDDAANFKQLSRHMIMRCDHELISSTMSKTLADIVPDDFRTNLSKSVEKLMRCIVSATYFPLGKAVAPQSSPGSTAKICAPQSQRIGAYVSHLHRVNALPPVPLYIDIGTIWSLLYSLGTEQNATEITAIKKCRGQCTFCDMDFAQLVKDNIVAVGDVIGFMCLKCVKSGNFERRLKGCDEHEK